MFLSKLLLNPRSRQVQMELSHPYELHRTLLRAFPHHDQGGPGRVLYRVEHDRDANLITILVQSICPPKWSALSVSHDYFYEPPQFKEFNPVFHLGQMLRFRLRANPTVKRKGKLLGLLKQEDQLAWLRRKAAQGGFALVSVRMIPEGIMRSRKTVKNQSNDMSHFAVCFDGLLQVQDPNAFYNTLAAGIGRGKAFGFGLLSVAPA